MPLRLFSVILLLSLSSTATSSPPTSFTTTIHSATAAIAALTSTISSLPSTTSDRRLSAAVADCLDLLDLSSSLLSLTLAAGDRRPSDTAISYLSGALGNQATCRDSLASASPFDVSLVDSGLSSVTDLISQSLAQFRSKSSPNLVSDSKSMITWAGDDVDADVVVAGDGSGDFLTVGEAVEAAPEESSGRFVIYVKSGVYYENVEISRSKWNLMIIGDGIDQTVISGSRNFIDGWTTYRSATVGEFLVPYRLECK